MTIFIIWPHDIDADFREHYALFVGEKIQDDPRSNGKSYVVGSSVITEHDMKELSAIFPDVVFTKTPPTWNEAKDDAGI